MLNSIQSLLNKHRPLSKNYRKTNINLRLGSFFVLPWLIMINSLVSYAQENNVSIIINATQPQEVIDGYLWGSNLTNESRSADQTVYDSAFVAAARQMGVRLIRWPGGNNADAYDWKNHVRIKPGRRIPWDGAVTLPEIAAFCQEIGAELSITVNFGTGTPEDAADLVEYLNGPADSEWGSLRASQGFPEPLNVRFFEIGNEINQPHQWYNSWTAENTYKYFFGGEEERRGDYQASENVDPIGKKGDAFRADGGNNQTYILRFPPVRNVQVLWAANEDDARNNVFEPWQQVSDLQTYGPNDRVFVLDSLTGTLNFGDNIHGAAPPQGSWFLVEYTTYGHKGFVDFARAMRQAPSSVPIAIGAVTGPFENQMPIASEDSLRMIFEEMDFLIAHQYGASFPTETYAQRRQIAYERTQGTARSRITRLQSAYDSLGVAKTPGLAITEWNIFLDEDSWQLNRTLEGAVIAAEFFIRTLNAGTDFPVWFANQFALGGVWLALYNNWTTFSISPMGYVFQGFKSWPGSRKLPVQVTSPSAMAYDQVLPYVQAAAALSATGDSLFLALSNNAEQETLTVHLAIEGFRYQGGYIHRLEGTSPTANNESDPANVVLHSQPLPEDTLDMLVLQPHSVVFLELGGTSVTAIGSPSSPITTLALYQNAPNPFNPTTHIRYRLPTAAHVQLHIYDIRGRRVRTLVESWQNAGMYIVQWDGRNDDGQRVSSGLYLYRLNTGKQMLVRRMLLLQ